MHTKRFFSHIEDLEFVNDTGRRVRSSDCCVLQECRETKADRQTDPYFRAFLCTLTSVAIEN
jgi:DNA-binding sugar fermentation-stimulating protein